MSLEDYFENLTPEQKAKAGGIELTPEQLESISGGHWYNGQGGY